MKLLFKHLAKIKIRNYLVAIFLFTIIVGFTLVEQDYFFKIHKGIEIFSRVYKEVTLKYVDEIDPEKFIQYGINGMMEALDPYTTYIPEDQTDEIELITSGKYGGIGVSIGLRDGHITIISLIEGYSARRQGLQPGDRILEIDGKSIKGMKPDQIRSMIRGVPGTEVQLKIERDGEKEPLVFVLIREEIQLKNITYAEFISDSIAYIRLERFSRTAGDELRLAIKELKLRGEIHGVILDMRDNPGGLLDEAVEVAEKFVPKGSLIVSTKGRRLESEKKYYSTEEPQLANIPLAVLINRNSASASEIVAGAIQDLDRGVIVGTRSFGKGLVQTIVPLVYNTQLKLTTAKYYTPSGRCIQEIDYLKRDRDGIFISVPESLRHEYKTSKGRSVWDHGGVYPDTVVEDPEQSDLQKELWRKSMYFKFANQYTSEHKDMPADLQPNEMLFEKFKLFLEKQGFSYQDEGEKKINEVKEIALKRQLSDFLIRDIENLQEKFALEKKGDIDREKSIIVNSVYIELMRVYKGERGRIEASLKDDRQVLVAHQILKDMSTYKRLLEAKKVSH